MNTLEQHKIVSYEDWLKTSAELLAKEKEFTKMRDEINALRRSNPWYLIEKNYTFQTEDGPKSLGDLFGDKSTLIVYHCMYAPGDTDGCPGCSFVMDHVDSARQHFEHHDLAYVACSRAPLADFRAFKDRLGWTLDWVSSDGSDFNYDMQASFKPSDLGAGPVLYNFTMQKLSGGEQPGLSVFYKDSDGNIYRTYSTYERGLDLLLTAYNYIDLTPMGRNESGPMDWVRFHDGYEN